MATSWVDRQSSVQWNRKQQPLPSNNPTRHTSPGSPIYAEPQQRCLCNFPVWSICFHSVATTIHRTPSTPLITPPGTSSAAAAPSSCHRGRVVLDFMFMCSRMHEMHIEHSSKPTEPVQGDKRPALEVNKWRHSHQNNSSSTSDWSARVKLAKISERIDCGLQRRPIQRQVARGPFGVAPPSITSTQPQQASTMSPSLIGNQSITVWQRF